MTSPVYTFTVPIYLNGLNTLAHILKKAEQHATEHDIALTDLINARLHDDMAPLTFQVQSTTTTALRTMAHATHTEEVKLDYNETTFEELYARIEKTVDILKASDPAAFSGKEQLPFKAKLGPYEVDFTAESYASRFGIPNFYFHLDMAYAILRSKGVPLGKKDYLAHFGL
ncbi:hypothetical protein FE257_011640 [Aspergillus nanangensis]|uniref:Uncharacterized protein n=1 Tax=Aspergillus nanangensis TaxID=2582783 RepID=A0AAD4GXR7_ASPNN|nr:hypothetical protein FE257_011640 [Aspergillus nanangensis]